MFKKTLISTLILATSSGLLSINALVAPTQAVIKRNNTEYWSFEEMVEFESDLNQKSTVACGDDEICKSMYIHEQREQSDTPEKFQALEYFKNERLIFPSINPDAERLTFYYKNQNNGDTAGMQSSPSIMRELYLAWVEGSVPDPRWQAFQDGDDTITPYTAEMRNGILSPGVHELYHGVSASEEENLFTPYLKITIDAAGSQLKSSQNFLIHFTLLTANHDNLLGAADYSTCFIHGDYEDGMECRVMYSAFGPQYFAAFPAEELKSDPGLGEYGFWSFAEILEFKKEIDAAAKEVCGGGARCEMEYLHEQFLAHPGDRRYSLVEQLKSTYGFYITTIDPERELITVYYNDEDYMEWQITDNKVHINLKDLYMAWVENGYADPRWEYVGFNDGVMDRFGPSYVADANQGFSREGTHLVFSHTPMDGDPRDSWLKNGEEITLNVSGSNLKNNISNQIHYAAFPYGAPELVDVVDYSQFSSEYKPGMIYQLMYDKYSTYPYWVPQGEAMPETPSEEKPDDTSSDYIQENTSTNDMGVPEIKTEVVAISSDTTSEDAFVNTPEIASENSLEATSGTTISTSDTVEVPLAAGKKEEHQFPWWLVVFAFSGIFLILWWFVPIRRRKGQEN